MKLISDRLLCVSLFSIFLLINLLSYGQKPKLGLVLSGGGAKGIAHIGILKAMEEAGLRPDYIAGTSMGSIIGGLYAIGYSADQIEQIVLEIDWDQVLSNNIPLNYISYEEKEYYTRFLIDLSIAEGKLQLPSGLIEGQMLSEALNHFTWPAIHYRTFDEFPIPFRCIGTDVSTGKAIIFKEGSLAEAMRASMAIPTAFTPADLDTTLSVDGGVVNNFPADVLKEWGADIIIGVNVNKGFRKAEEVNSISGILMQMAMLSSNEKLKEQSAMCDVYIQPDLNAFSAASFSKYKEILEIGHKAGQLNRPALDSIAGILGKTATSTIKSDPHDGHEDVQLGDIDLTGNSLFNETLIRGKLGLTQGDSAGPTEVEEGVRNVFGINGFRKVEYSMSKTDNGSMHLKLKMNEKPPATIRASFHYDNVFSAGIVLNLQVRDLLLKSSRTILAGDISENPRFRLDYYKYVGRRQRVALNLRYDYNKEQLPVYEKGSKTDVQVTTENYVALNFLTTHSLRNSFLIGMSYENNKFRSAFSGLFPDAINYGTSEWLLTYFSYNRNSLNNRNYPTGGAERLLALEIVPKMRYHAEFHDNVDSIFTSLPGDSLLSNISEDYLNNELDKATPSVYGQFYGRSLDFFRIAENFQMIPTFALSLNFSLDSANMLYRERNVGGYQQVKISDTRFTGLNYGEYRLLNFAIGGLFFQNVIMRNFFLSYGANALIYSNHIPLDNANFDFQEIVEDQFLIGYGGKITYRSFIGPVSFGVSSNTLDGYVRYYFSLGFSFNYTD